MAEELNKTISEAADKVVKAVQDKHSKVLSFFETEQRKAQIRSEIGHTERELKKAYEKLGRDYFKAVSDNSSMAELDHVLDLIRSKEKVISLLQEKLETL